MCLPGGQQLSGGEPLPGRPAHAAGGQISGSGAARGRPEDDRGRPERRAEERRQAQRGQVTGTAPAPGGQNNRNAWLNDGGRFKNFVLCVLRDHDEYGFKIIPDYEVEDMKLLAKIQALEIRSHNLLHQVRSLRYRSSGNLMNACHRY